MINFVQEKYGIEATCSHVCQDGHDVKNLVANPREKSFITKRSGFLVEHYIKPPVEVNILFPFPAQIAYIELGLSVGAQTTDGIDILVTDEPKGNDTGILQVVYHQCPIKDTSLRIFNGSFKSMPPFQFGAEESLDYRNATKNRFKSSHLLKNVRVVKVRIIKTVGSSVPALGSVKIFGEPGSRCEHSEWNRILQVHTCTDESAAHNEDDDIQILSPDETEIKKNEKFAAQIPEEFLDPLTLEVMALPMLLPSGHTVDQSTIEKMNSTQASWGRLPCDPFTGIPYGSSRKPVSNIPLKARLDAFLFKNACLDSQLACVPRALGRKPKDFTSKTNLSAESSFTHSSSIPAVSSSSKVETVILPALSDNNASTETSHEMALQNSLDAALQTYYSAPGPTRRGELKEKDACVGCKETYPSSCYKLPCGHLLCRKCLVASQNFCLQCLKPFLKEQVHRTYNIP